MSRSIIQRSIAVCLFLGTTAIAKSQNNVGIGTVTPHASAILEASSTTKGILIPRMNTAQRSAIPSPAIGLLVFDTDLKQFIFSSDTGWVKIPAGNIGVGPGSNSWMVNGQNQYSALTGNVGIGVDSATNKLHVGGSTRMDGKLGIRTGTPGSLGEDLSYAVIESVSDNSNESDFNMVLIEDNSFSPYINSAKARGTKAAPQKVQADDNLLSLFGHGHDGLNFRNVGGIELRVADTTSQDNIATKMIFSTSDSGTTALANRMVIDQRGNVGIGNNNPSERLDIAGKTKTTNLQITNGAENGYVLHSDAEGNAYWAAPGTGSNTWTVAGSNQFSALSGNVGIGNNTPFYKLTVGNGITIGGANPIAAFNTQNNSPVLVGDTSSKKRYDIRL